MRKSKKAGIIVIIAGMIFIMSAVGLWVYNSIEDSHAAQATEMAQVLISRIGSDPEAVIKPAIERKPELAFETESAPSTDELPLMSVMQHESYWYIGVVSIPDLGLSLPVMADWDYSRLKIAPCRYSGSVYEDSLVIAAHNYRSHFGNISSLQIGSTVTFTDVTDTIFTYEVMAVETLQSDDIRGMIKNEYDLTLFTCTYGGAARITVRCSRVSDI